MHNTLSLPYYPLKVISFIKLLVMGLHYKNNQQKLTDMCNDKVVTSPLSEPSASPFF